MMPMLLAPPPPPLRPPLPLPLPLLLPLPPPPPPMRSWAQYARRRAAGMLVAAGVAEAAVGMKTARDRAASGMWIDGCESGCCCADIAPDGGASVGSTGAWLLKSRRRTAVEVGGRSTGWPTPALLGGGLDALRERNDLLCTKPTGGGAAGLTPRTAILLFSVRTAKPEDVATNEGVGEKGALTVKAGVLSLLHFVGPYHGSAAAPPSSDMLALYAARRSSWLLMIRKNLWTGGAPRLCPLTPPCR